MAKEIALLIPCYNEEKRLNIAVLRSFISKNSKNIDFIFVDDGSTDSTADLISNQLVDEKDIFLIKLKSNFGKGNAIREGFLQNFDKPYKYFGFVDADLDIPFHQVNRLYFELTNSNFMVAISRRRLFRNMNFTRIRSLGSVLMLLIANRIISFRPQLNDTQCGCKLFKKEVIEICFREKFISDWLFDIEIFLRLKREIEYPRQVICEISLPDIAISGNSKFEIRKNFKIVKQLYEIRKHYT